MSRRFEEMKASLSEKLVVMQSECNELRSRERWREDAIEREAAIKLQATSCCCNQGPVVDIDNSAAGRQNRQDSLEDAEDSGSRDAVRMATVAISAYKDLPDEIDSLKTVLELKQREIAELRSEKAELQEKLGSLADVKEANRQLQYKLENLEALIQLKTDNEKILQEKHQQLMRKFDQESRAKTRLSMNYDELKFKMEAMQLQRESPPELSMSMPAALSTEDLSSDSGQQQQQPVMTRSLHGRGLQHDRQKRKTIACSRVEELRGNQVNS
uniref:Coiled-coil domain-containing protein 67 n=1 Tax=Macrostomum lignano TaxID=282301 RepID=A0A1I8IJA5_9PLAT